jgi:predicted dehydrogenase
MSRFAVIGWGWRAEFFARAAAELSNRVRLSAVVTRDGERARAAEARWRVPAYASIDDLLGAERVDFAVLSVPAAVAPRLLGALSAAGLPALCETPPAADLESLVTVCELARRGPPIQVAEQYPLQPLHAARIALCRGGVIGAVSVASVSFSHGYHAFAVLRRLLGVRGETTTIRAVRRAAPAENGNTRAGPRREITVLDRSRTVAVLEFGDRLGLYDFEDDQHRSYVRLAHVGARGTHGEISDDRLRVVRGLDEVLTLTLERVVAGQEGDMTGHTLLGITGVDGWAWRNPFPGSRLADDEIAVGECLVRMAEHVEGAPPFYGVADGAQDHYLYLALQQAAGSGGTVRAAAQPWADRLLD